MNPYIVSCQNSGSHAIIFWYNITCMWKEKKKQKTLTWGEMSVAILRKTNGKNMHTGTS